MDLLIFAETVVSRVIRIFDEEGEIIFIDGSFLIEPVVPDKGAVVSVFSNCAVPDHVPVEMQRLEIKHKYSAGEQESVDSFKELHHIFVGQKIIDTVSYADEGAGCAVELKFPHILAQIQRSVAQLVPALQRHAEHLFRQINAHDVISSVGKDLSQLPRPAGQVYDEIFFRGKKDVS